MAMSQEDIKSLKTVGHPSCPGGYIWSKKAGGCISVLAYKTSEEVKDRGSLVKGSVRKG